MLVGDHLPAHYCLKGNFSGMMDMMYVECILTLFPRFIIYREAAHSIYHCLFRARSYPMVTRYFNLFSKIPIISNKIPRACCTDRIPGVGLPISSRGLGGRRTF